jgi:hypothetical protein
LLCYEKNKNNDLQDWKDSEATGDKTNMPKKLALIKGFGVISVYNFDMLIV